MMITKSVYIFRGEIIISLGLNICLPFELIKSPMNLFLEGVVHEKNNLQIWATAATLERKQSAKVYHLVFI